VADIGELAARATLDNSDFINAIKALSEQIQSGMEAAGSAFDGIGEKLGKVGEALAGFELGKKILEFGEDCLEASKNVSKLRAAFEAINGPADSTKELFESLEGMKFSSMFDLATTLGPAAKDMLAMGISAEQTAKNMQALVDAASAMKQSPEWIGRVAETLGRMNLMGEVTSRTMRMLTTEQIPAWQALADHIGTDVPGAMEQVKKGLISAQVLNDAVVEELEGRFGGAAERILGTWRGQLNQISKDAETFRENVGNAISGVLQKMEPILAAINQAFSDFNNWFKNLPGPVQDAAVALGTVLAVVPLIGSAIAAVSLALEVFGTEALASITMATGGLALIIPALVLIGEWVYAHWQPIVDTVTQAWSGLKEIWQGVWSDILQVFGPALNAIGSFFHMVFDPIVSFAVTMWDGLKSAWTTTWNNIIAIVQPIWDFIIGGLKQIATNLGIVFTTLGNGASLIKDGLSKIASLGETWKSSNAQLDAANKKVKDQQAAMDALKTATGNLNAAERERQNTANQQAIIDQNRAKADQQAAAAAQKAQEEQNRQNQAILTTYNTMMGVAPAAAKQFADSVDVIDNATGEAQKSMGKAWDTIGTDMQNLVIQIFALKDAYHTLGMTSTEAMQEQSDKAQAAYALISGSAYSSASDIQVAMDKVYAAHKKVTDQLNTDLSDAYKNGELTAVEYYDQIAQRANDRLTTIEAAMAQGKASALDLWTAQKEAADATAASVKADTDTLNAAYHAFGLKSRDELQQDITKWGDYAAAVAANSGMGTVAQMQAQLQYLVNKKADLIALGEPLGSINQQIETLKQKLEAAKSPADQLTDAMKALGLVSIGDQLTNLANLNTALTNVQKLKQSGEATDADVYNAQKKVADQTQAMIDQLNGPWQDAYKQGNITATELYQNAYANSQTLTQQLVANVGTLTAKYGADSPQVVQAINQVNAAIAAQGVALENLSRGPVIDMANAYKTANVQSLASITEFQTRATAAYQAIADSAGPTSMQAQQAWVTQTTATIDLMVAQGKRVPVEMQNALDATKQAIVNAGPGMVSQWKSIYDGVHGAVSQTFSSLTDLIVTGKGSFKEVMTTMWQDVAKAAINGFLTPVTTAISNFISTTIANLLGGQGLGGVSSAFSSIGGSVSKLFGGAGGAAGGAGGSITQAVSGVMGAATGALTAIGSLGSMVTGIIGDIQSAHQTNILKSIEHNTRYSMMYLGEQSDQGIFGLLTAIRQDIEWGGIYKAVADASGEWIAASPIIQSYLKGIYESTMLNMWPLMQTMEAVLENIRDFTKNTSDVLNNFQAVGFGGSAAAATATVASATASNATPQTVNVNITPKGLTTAEAAKALGNQIAVNLTGQGVRVTT
jgi:tape measure domain-containing protein